MIGEEKNIDIEEFYQELWNNVSESTVSTNYIVKNRDFIDELTFDLYRIYLQSPLVDFSIISRIVESFFRNSKLHNPKN